MIPFRGNCEQVKLLEQLIRHLGGEKIWLVSSGDNAPLFEEQSDFQPIVRYRQYWVRTDSGNKFIPNIYPIKFVFNENEGILSEVHMPREVIDWLLKQGIGEPIKNLAIIVGDDGKDIPVSLNLTAKPVNPNT
jgi:hypothetical protein